MNQHISSIATKRVPGQYHLALYTQPIYKGLPVLNCQHGFVDQYLDRLYRTIHHALQSHSRVFAVRVDLHFPTYYSPTGQLVLSNEYLQAFIKAFRRRLKKYSDQKSRLQQRVHDMGFEYVWAREHGPESGKPHFHILLLLNGNSFNTLGSFSNHHESLYNRICESWAEVLGLHVSEGAKYSFFPIRAQYMVRSGESLSLAELFQRTSYLAKVRTKSFHDGYHVFGSSR